MKTRVAYRYQVSESYKSVIVFYCIIIAVYILTFVAALSFNRDGGSVSFTGGMDIASIIFLFVLGLCSLKENFCMLSQNGLSRKTIFIGWLLTAISMAIFMALADRLIATVAGLVGSTMQNYTAVNLFEMSYKISGFPMYIANILFSFSLYLMIIMKGYFITNLFFRLSKIGKTLVAIIVPLFIFILYPALDFSMTGGEITKFLIGVAAYLLGHFNNLPWLAVITFLVGAGVFSLFAWLLMRKAVVRK